MMGWLRWTRRGRDETDKAVRDSQARLQDARRMVADAQPVIRKERELRRRNHLSESVAAALDIWGARP
jgi:hypothetical protein